MHFSFKKFFEKMFWTLINLIRGVSIYKRLIISFMIIILIPNLLISYYSFNISSRELENKFSSSSRQALTGVEVTLNEKLKLYESLSYQVYNNSEILELLKKCNEYKSKMNSDAGFQQKYEDCKKKLGNVLFQISPKVNISNLQIVLGEDQIIQIDNNGMKCGSSIDDIASFIKSKNYQKSIEADGLPVWFDTSKEIRAFKYEPYGTSYIANYITLLRSIPDSVPNKSLGVIVMNIPTKIFLEMVDFQSMYDSKEVVFLSGGKGIVSVLNGRYVVDMPDKDILDEIADKKDGTIVRSISKKEYILTFSYQERLNATIVYMAERSKILTGVFRVRNIIFEVTVICIICALILAYFVTASISLPMNKLKRAMGKVGENELRTEYLDAKNDEIGVLGNKFNSMMKRIGVLIENLVEKEVLRKNEEINRKEAELDALQMQIKPHFMYNTLDLIRWNAMFAENGEGKISKMIAEFSTLLRFNAIKSQKLVEINEEIEHVRAYANVLRFKSELRLEIIVEIQDKAILNNKITKFTLQPIIENSVKHGLISMETQGIVSIRAYKSKDDLYIEVKDNGIGMSREQLDIINSSLINREAGTKSIGLRNVNERIILHFGEGYGIKVISEEGKYTSVVVHIPTVD